jgi:hypothetical protein
LYLTGADSIGATQTFPQAGPDSRAMYQVNDGLAATNGWQNFRIIMTSADTSFQHRSINVMSNDRLEATVIDREEDIYYGCGVRLKSSQRGRANLRRVGYSVRFPSDGLYRGALDSVAIDRSESQTPGQRELLFDIMIANSGGVISRYYDFVKVLAPNSSLTGGGLLQMARYGDVFLDSQFDNGGDGQLYEYELIYYPTSEDANGFKRPQPDSVTGSSVSNHGDEPELYRTTARPTTSRRLWPTINTSVNRETPSTLDSRISSMSTVGSAAWPTPSSAGRETTPDRAASTMGCTTRAPTVA